MRIFIIGGTGFIGPHLVSLLNGAGHEVTVFHRGRTRLDRSEGVHEILCPEHPLGDRSYFAAFADEFRRAAPDLVIDMLPTTEESARTVMDAFRGLARRIVAISSQDVYRAYGLLIGIESGSPDAVPLNERAPLRERLYPYRSDPRRASDDPQRWMDDYEKILVERVVMSDPELSGTVLRLPMVYGPRDRQHRLFEHLKRMTDARPVILLDARLAEWRWTRSYVENVAAAVALAATDERSAGRIYNVGEPETTPLGEWVQAIAREAAWDGQVLALPPDRLPEPLQAKIRTEQDLLTDSALIREELGYQEPVPLEEALARTVEWEAANPPERIDESLFDYAAEDVALAEWRGIGD